MRHPASDPGPFALPERKPVFVFGSNRAGHHETGAALHAATRHGALQGVGEGLTGSAYAIPTRDERLRVLPPEEVERGIVRFIHFARDNPAVTFHLTPVGCDEAGYKRREVWAILSKWGLPPNVLLTSSWVTW